MAFDEKYPLALPAGTVLAGRYIIEKVLGQGGFGITYRAVDHKTNDKVAIKEFFPDTLAYREGTTVVSYPGERSENYEYGKEGFLQEAQTLAEFIGCENIVRIHTYFEENGTAYFAMDYIEGVSFDEYLKERGGKISCDEAEKILLPIMDALYLVHSKGIVHRDVTPDNIYITNDGKVKLLDFGAARYSLGDKSRSLDVILKHGFAPKEQYTRRGKQGPFTDIYSLGATFYFALTGRRPPDSVDRLEEDDLIPPSSLGVQITEYQEQAILQALSVQPGDRFESMLAFKNVFLNEKQQAPVQPVYAAPVQQPYVAPVQQTPVQPIQPTVQQPYTAPDQQEPVQQEPVQQTVVGKTQAVANNEAKDEPKPEKPKKSKKPAIIAGISAGVVGIAAAIIVPIAVNSSGSNVPTGEYSSSPNYSSNPSSASSSSPSSNPSSSSGATSTTTGDAQIIGNTVGNIKNGGYISESAYLNTNLTQLKVWDGSKWNVVLEKQGNEKFEVFNLCEDGNIIYFVHNGKIKYYDKTSGVINTIDSFKNYDVKNFYISADYFFIYTTDKKLHRVSRATYAEEESKAIKDIDTYTFGGDKIYHTDGEFVFVASSTNFKNISNSVSLAGEVSSPVFDNGYLYLLQKRNSNYYILKYDANLKKSTEWKITDMVTAACGEGCGVGSLNVVDDQAFFTIYSNDFTKIKIYHYRLSDNIGSTSMDSSVWIAPYVFKRSYGYELNYVGSDGKMKMKKYDLNGYIIKNT